MNDRPEGTSEDHSRWMPPGSEPVKSWSDMGMGSKRGPEERNQQEKGSRLEQTGSGVEGLYGIAGVDQAASAVIEDIIEDVIEGVVDNSSLRRVREKKFASEIKNVLGRLTEEDNNLKRKLISVMEDEKLALGEREETGSEDMGVGRIETAKMVSGLDGINGLVANISVWLQSDLEDQARNYALDDSLSESTEDIAEAMMVGIRRQAEKDDLYLGISTKIREGRGKK
jgi:hypothetical protein